ILTRLEGLPGHASQLAIVDPQTRAARTVYRTNEELAGGVWLPRSGFACEVRSSFRKDVRVWSTEGGQPHAIPGRGAVTVISSFGEEPWLITLETTPDVRKWVKRSLRSGEVQV